jgi:hypothetical protein
MLLGGWFPVCQRKKVPWSFLGVKRQGRGADHPPPSSAEVKEKAELYLYSLLPLCSFVACSRVNCTLTFLNLLKGVFDETDILLYVL